MASVFLIESPRLCRLLNIGGISLGIAIIVNDKNNQVLVNHELIHIAQWRELWFVGFLLWYLWEYLKNGYSNNRFEKEAYAKQYDLTYLSTRKKFAFLHH